MVKEGDIAPDFILKHKDGQIMNLSDFRGQRVVLYFYPKDDTPGCTKEACSFRDANDVFEEKNIKVLGVSPDDDASHTKFSEKYNLPFQLLSDPDHKIAESYGAYGDKKFMGKEYKGVLRKTFLIDEQGRIAKIFDKVNVSEHADEVLRAFGE
jgi:thioredoxin-dependent peroxiredoxin